MPAEEPEATADLIAYPLQEGWYEALQERLNIAVQTLPNAEAIDPESDVAQRKLSFKGPKKTLSLQDLLHKFREDFGVEIIAVPMGFSSATMMHNTGAPYSEIPFESDGEVMMFQIVANVGEVILTGSDPDMSEIASDPFEEEMGDVSFNSKDIDDTNSPLTTNKLKQITDIIRYWWRRMRGC